MEARQFLSIPVLIGGRAVARIGEYEEGILCRCRLADRQGHNPRWHLSFHPRGWLYKPELNATNREIIDHIADEAGRGETPLTGLNRYAGGL